METRQEAYGRHLQQIVSDLLAQRSNAQAVVCARSVLGGLHQEYSLGPALA
jgi:hypothetical protein